MAEWISLYLKSCGLAKEITPAIICLAKTDTFEPRTVMQAKRESMKVITQLSVLPSIENMEFACS